MRIGKLFLYVALAAGAVGAGGCVPDAPPRIELAAATAVPVPMGLVFWVDGLDIEAFESLRAAGRLPNISRFLIDRGVTVRAAVTSLPTVTYPNNVSLATGLFPGHHEIVGNRWFDRRSLVFQDYGCTATYRQVDHDFRAATVYERLADDLTASILTPVRRGAGRNVDNWATAGVAWFFGYQATVNHLTTLRFELLGEVANRTGRWPKFILAYFVTPDTVGHAGGVSGPRYTEMLLDIDRQIGHVCRGLQAAGLLERTFLTLVSDHGFVDTPRHFDVAGYFAKTLKVPLGSRRIGAEVPLEKRAERFAHARAVVVVNGDRQCTIHLRAGEHWHRRPTEAEIYRFPHAAPAGTAVVPIAPAGTGVVAAPGAGETPAVQGGPTSLPELLAALPAVELAVVRTGCDSADVLSAAGAGAIDRVVSPAGKRYRYRVTSGADPLGYASHAPAAGLMDGGHHSADEWLAATIATGKPDVVGQLIEMLDSPRSGDVVLFAAEGWDFGHRNRGGHGGLLRREIIVPWVWAGPGLPAGAVITGARTVDLAPTMLDLLGRPVAGAEPLDGKSLAPRLRAAEAPRLDREISLYSGCGAVRRKR